MFAAGVVSRQRTQSNLLKELFEYYTDTANRADPVNANNSTNYQMEAPDTIVLDKSAPANPTPGKHTPVNHHQKNPNNLNHTTAFYVSLSFCWVAMKFFK